MGKEVYQIKYDNQARRNTFKKGVAANEHYGTNQMENTGVPLIGFKGVPKESGRGQFGIPIPGQGKVSRKEPEAPTCGALNKKGEPCKAHPVKGEAYCVGHMRGQNKPA